MRTRLALGCVALTVLSLMTVSLTLPVSAEAAGRARKKDPSEAPPTTVSPPVTSPDAGEPPSGDGSVRVERESAAFGRKMGLAVEASVPETGDGLDASFSGTLIDKKKSLAQYEIEASPDLSRGKAGFFVGGVELVGIEFPLNGGAWKKHYGLAPVEAKVGMIGAPVGPLLVTVGAGFSLEAQVDATVTPFAAVPIENSSLQINVSPVVKSLAFAEGSVGLLVLKAGVRGEVVLIDANLQLYTQIYTHPSRPQVTAAGTLEYLSGDFYGFLDYFNILFWSWDHLWKRSLFRWSGYCRDFNGSLESSGACYRP